MAGVQWRSWFRHCASSWKVATSIFHWHNPSGRTMALGSTQPLIEMSTTSIPGGSRRPVLRADLTTFMCRLSENLGVSTFWNPLGLYRDCFTFTCSNRPTNMTPHLTLTLKFFTVAHYNHTAPSNTDASSNLQKLHQLFQKLHPTVCQHFPQNTIQYNTILSNIFQTGFRPMISCSWRGSSQAMCT